MAARKKTTTTEATTTEVFAEPVDTNEQKFTPRKEDIDLSQRVTVRNGFNGRLVYTSGRTRERFVWGEFGDEQDMELRDLRDAKNAKKQFFERNYFMFEEDWIPEFLGVAHFYKNAVPIDSFDDVFKQTPAKVKDALSKMSAGQRRSATYRARQLVNDGDIDSLKVISAIEDALGIELVERQ